MDLRQYTRTLRAHWLMIVVAVIVCTAAAGALAETRTPTYEAQTSVFVSTTGGSPDVGEEIVPPDEPSERRGEVPDDRDARRGGDGAALLERR